MSRALLSTVSTRLATTRTSNTQTQFQSLLGGLFPKMAASASSAASLLRTSPAISQQHLVAPMSPLLLATLSSFSGPYGLRPIGPMIDYLANCNGDCTTVDKTKLLFNKIDEAGLINGSPPPGTWASDTKIANNNSWISTIPSTIAPGNYVLRHETITLHSAENVGGAQAYPQCINLKITGSVQTLWPLEHWLRVFTQNRIQIFWLTSITPLSPATTSQGHH